MLILDGYSGKVFCGNFSKDGNYFITASQGLLSISVSDFIFDPYIFLDRQIRLYQSGNGSYKFFNKINARDVGWSIIDVAFSPDQESFVYSSWSTSCKK